MSAREYCACRKFHREPREWPEKEDGEVHWPSGCLLLCARCKELEAKLAATMDLLTGQRESFERTRPLCSGCVDKQSGRGCIACERDRAEAKLAEAERENEALRNTVVDSGLALGGAESREKALAAENETLRGALIGLKVKFVRPDGGPCWCDTARLICVEQERCKAARAALAAGKERP